MLNIFMTHTIVRHCSIIHRPQYIKYYNEHVDEVLRLKEQQRQEE
eukprot:UN05813